MAAAREKVNKNKEDIKEKKEEKSKDVTTFRSLFGFEISDLSSPQAVVKLLNRPTDPSSLGVLRIFYGLLMLIDIPQERGMAYADRRFGNTAQCRFPLFNFLQPLPLEWMFVIYFIMVLGATGIMLGLKFRASCIMFAIPYWYIFFLDKTVWNNHSYLYGMISILLLLSDANRYLSIDGLLNKEKRNAHVPLWNYTLFRTQLFLVYFIAGIKKLEKDWLGGYSMRLSNQWVFSPFKILLSDEQIDFFVVHLCGWALDMFGGFLLFFDKTRPYTTVFVVQFHLMNSQMFSIGMFPYTMLASTPMFYYADWPKYLLRKLPASLQSFVPMVTEPQPSVHCIYNKEDIKPEDTKDKPGTQSKIKPPTSATRYHKIATIITMLYISEQCFLPYSHFITKGYNNWTQGLYGYSWDMMVHSWSTQHVRITYKDLESGDIGYLDPEAFTYANRWASHGDMLKQYATCLSDRLKKYDIKKVELYFDIWKSVNRRFQQRMFDPRVDIVSAPWSPFVKTSYVLPLLVDLSDWRGKLVEIRKELRNTSKEYDVVFVADFPGLHLENFIQKDLTNTTITVLQGDVVVEIESENKNYSLKPGEKMQLPYDAFHNVYTVGDQPSCYMYIYINTTEAEFARKLKEYSGLMNDTENGIDRTEELAKFDNDTDIENIKNYYQAHREQKKEKRKKGKLNSVADFIRKKYSIFSRTASFVSGAIKSIITRQPFEEFLNATYAAEREEERKKKPKIDTSAILQDEGNVESS